jgi:hypothetical protein
VAAHPDRHAGDHRGAQLRDRSPVDHDDVHVVDDHDDGAGSDADDCPCRSACDDHADDASGDRDDAVGDGDGDGQRV